MAREGFTRVIASALVSRRFDSLPGDVRQIAKQSVLDCLGVAIAGAAEPPVPILVEDADAEGRGSSCSLIGRYGRASIYQAALINGTAAHALDYDDVNVAMLGHPSAAILPGLLALAEAREANGAALLTAFVSGCEAACEIGKAVAAGHYGHGFHSTATLGTFGAAGACSHLLGLDREQTANALGIAGTQAAGLKAMFGTMCKPFHAGKASQNGVRSALLAMRGLSSCPDVLETAQGFFATQCHGFSPERVNGGTANADFHIRRNLFKYHAACFSAHAAIEALRALTGGRPVAPDSLDQVVLRVDKALDKICNIATPRNGIEAKFSLRVAAAFVLAGLDTARLDTYSDSNAVDPVIVTLRDKVSVELMSLPDANIIEVVMVGCDGSRVQARHDSGVPESDVTKQGIRVREKFHSLVDPVLGAASAGRLLALVDALETLPSVAIVAQAAAG